MDRPKLDLTRLEEARVLYAGVGAMSKVACWASDQPAPDCFLEDRIDDLAAEVEATAHMLIMPDDTEDADGRDWCDELNEEAEALLEDAPPEPRTREETE